MKTRLAKISFFLDRRHELKNGMYPVKLNVFYKGIKRRFNIGIIANEVTWKKYKSATDRENQVRLLKRKLSSLQNKAEDIIEKLPSFSFLMFSKAFFGVETKIHDSLLTSRFSNYINKLESEGRISTAESFGSTKNSFQQFKGNVFIQDVTSDYLEEYKRYMAGKKASPTTTGIYMRQLRRIINIAIRDGIIPPANAQVRKFHPYNVN